MQESNDGLNIFFSYSHQDEKARNELEKHFAMLKREGLIRCWHDRRIEAGMPLDSVISENLESSDVILLLASPDFIASDYCYDIEMTRALERHHKNEARVIPVILESCDWRKAPFGRLRATPPDGKPIAKHANLNDAYLAVTEDLRAVVEELAKQKGRTRKPVPLPPSSSASPASRSKRSSNLRVKRKFTEKEKDDFLEQSFEYISRFFDNSLLELEGRNKGASVKFRLISGLEFEAAVYVNGQCLSRARVWFEGEGGFRAGIYYSAGNSTFDDRSYNELLTIEEDGYILGLKTSMHFASIGDNRLTQEGAAEYLWSKLMEPLQ